MEHIEHERISGIVGLVKAQADFPVNLPDFQPVHIFQRKVMDKYKNGYEITSFPAESFDGGVNESLQKGDIVDVYALNPDTELLELFAENVYVSEVYDNAGNRITNPDGVATSFTVWVTPKEVESVNFAVVYGKVQIYLKTE